MAALIKQQHEDHIKENPHVTFRIIELPITPVMFAIVGSEESIPGMISIEMCNECGYIQNTQCTHMFSDGAQAHRWYGDKLLCMICRMDAT